MTRYLTLVTAWVAGGFLGGCAVGVVAFLIAARAMEAEDGQVPA